jgi:SAM-dependent methyltransferase
MSRLRLRAPAAVSAALLAVRRDLPWPLPAVLAWCGAWVAWSLVGPARPALAFVAGLLVAATLAWWGSDGLRRRLIAAVGFPASALALGLAPALPPWAWLLALLPLLAAYPLRAWRDAPFYPTPPGALHALPGVVTPAPRRVLDAGCGLGHGLAALRRAWPEAELHGVEWSAPLAALAGWRCRRLGARVHRGDMWSASWAGHDLVYVFQRPESMARAWDKACAEMAPGSWLVSLAFAVPGVTPVARLPARAGRSRELWVYRLPSPGTVRRSTATATGR